MSTSNTKSQERAIIQSGNVLVVAGAGTGKTRTLVQRCVRLLLDRQRGLDRILMVTFTEAAAAEMRKRIRDELRKLERSETGTARTYIRNQLLLLDAAHIGTLHSFCLHLIRRHTHQLGIDPCVAVLDEQQAAPLISDVLDRMFRKYYADETGSGRLHAFIRQVGGGSDTRIRSLILRVHRHSQSLADPETWLAGQERDYSDAKPTVWLKWFERAFSEWRNEWLPELKEFAHIPEVRAFIEAPAADEALDALATLDIEEEENGADELKKRKAFWKDVHFLRTIFNASSGAAVLAEEWDTAREHVLTLLRLTREFTGQYAAAKRQVGGLDFADLEQLALRLLFTPAGKPSAVATQWRERFDFIFVDECQDINRAQDAIIRAVSRDGDEANRFLVGDVKQSIFRFRRADPGIFTDYDSRWGKKSGGERIPLSDNFRSRESILTFVNALFSGLMRSSVGGVAYRGDAHLQFANPQERAQFAAGSDSGVPRVELHLINPADEEKERESDDEENGGDNLLELTKTEREARLAAKLLHDLRESKHLVWDEEEKRLRSVEWKHMAVLLRSVSGRVESYAKEFHKAGVPLVAARSGFFEAIEVSDLLNLLRVLDNPIQDVPLLAVLRSPLAAFSLEELAAIRIRSPKTRVWHALRNYHRSAPPSEAGWAKVDGLLTQLHQWRALARQSSVNDCLRAILAETHYEALLLAETRGEERVANVHRLLDLARHYDPYQRQGLYRFLKFVQAQQEEDVEHEPASSQTEDAVRLMTIHGSKGLEFPVVLLGELGKRFNLQDLAADMLIQDRYGICPKIWPQGAIQNYPGLAHWIGSRAEKREQLGEEMRLLYVAVTRARDTLLLTGTTGKRDRWSSERGRDITDREVVTASSYLDWLLKWLPSVTLSTDWTSEREGRNALLRWRMIDADDPTLRLDRTTEVRTGAAAPLSESTLNAIQKRLAWQYPHFAATREPAVKRVSEVIWNAGDSAEEQQLVLEYSAATVESPFRSSRRRGDLTAADVGNAHHWYLQSLPLDRTLSTSTLQKHAEQLVRDRVLTREEADAVDIVAIGAFWNGPIGQKILARAEAIQREMPFTARFSPEDLAAIGVCANSSELQQEFFVTRGAVDLVVLLPNELWILDFKTDRIHADDLPNKTLVYGRQLKLYGLALGRIYRRQVIHRWLHFLSVGTTVEI